MRARPAGAELFLGDGTESSSWQLRLPISVLNYITFDLTFATGFKLEKLSKHRPYRLSFRIINRKFQ